MTLKIRPMVAADKPRVIKILRNTPEFNPAEVAVAEELIDCYLQDGVGSGYNTYVADIDFRVVGYICYGPTPLTESTWDIYWIAVAHEKQGQGTGAALVRSAEEEIKKAGGRLVLIETSSKPDYEKTRRFYFGRGYEQITRIPDFYAVGDDKLVLQKHLA